MPDQRYFVELAYDGSPFHGWQIQPNAATVQEELEKALGLLLRHPAPVTGCGRTDTGVHAKQYFAHFNSPNSIDTEKLVFKLNRLLPPGIGIMRIDPVAESAHARFNAEHRTYRYFIHYQKNPFRREHSWHLYGKRLDLGFMNRMCEILIETEDFAAFAKTGSDVTHTRCLVHSAAWYWDEDQTGIYFEIRANRFLRNMVRAVVGTLVEAGEGKLSEEDFRNIIKSGNRSEAGTSAPAQGLFLWDIGYPEWIWERELNEGE
ncbi:tRNA pseudouridine(38-40) synthase TruA [bacterium SCSIO 12741]|nr:tRNA pseudouridine(38-40) synthase TruA [bacterium SCSIO 12741]